MKKMVVFTNNKNIFLFSGLFSRTFSFLCFFFLGHIRNFVKSRRRFPLIFSLAQARHRKK